jgi:hypothetical protein
MRREDASAARRRVALGARTIMTLDSGFFDGRGGIV